MIRGRVAHITCARNLRSIRKRGILGNADGTLSSGCGFASNSYFRLRNHVSLFDGRTCPPDVFANEWMKCGPHLALSSCSYRIAILFLHANSYSALVPWTAWKDEEAWSQKIVPHIECGHPAPVPPSAIEEVVVVRSRPRSMNSFCRAIAKLSKTLPPR